MSGQKTALRDQWAVGMISSWERFWRSAEIPGNQEIFPGPSLKGIPVFVPMKWFGPVASEPQSAKRLANRLVLKCFCR